MAAGKRRRTPAERIASQQKLRARHVDRTDPAQLPTRERLAAALVQAGAPAVMVDRARAGYYDEYNADAVLPLMELVDDARAAHLDDIVRQAVRGDFDATQEEADLYWTSAEGRATVAELTRMLATTDKQLAAVADANRSPVGPDGTIRAGTDMWKPPAGPDYDALNHDAVHAVVNLGARSGATNFQIGPKFIVVGHATNSWTAVLHFDRVGAKIQVWSQPSPSVAADELARKVLRGARCTDCGGMIRCPGDRGVWFPAARGERATYHDGHTLTVEEALKLSQCRWRRVGRRWYAGCELTRAAALVSQSTGSEAS